MERTIKVRTFLGQAIDTFKEYIKTKGNLQIDYSLEEYMQEILDYIDYLEKENQELKKQLHEASLTIQEMTEQDIECPSNCEKLRQLKKQLEEYKRLGFKYLQDKNNNLETQQKEFINYLEDKINYYKRNTQCFSMNLIEEILQKYKSVIGVSDENN